MGIWDTVARAFKAKDVQANEETLLSREPSGSPDGPVSPEDVMVGCSLTTRKEALHALSARAVELGIAEDEQALVEAFLQRESEGTTGMMDGFAIPHAKASTIKRRAVLVAKSDSAIASWETMDGEPVSVIVALLVPEDQAGTDHLRMLANMAEALMDSRFRSMLRRSDDPREISAEVNRHLQ